MFALIKAAPQMRRNTGGCAKMFGNNQGSHYLRRIWRPNRRSLLRASGASALGLLAGGVLTLAKDNPVRSLAIQNIHTGENLTTEYWAEGNYLPAALTQISHVLRDHMANETGPVDPALLDILHRLGRAIGTREALHVHAGFRAPSGKDRLIALTGGVPSRSLHLHGMAVDIALPGFRPADLYRAARSLQLGGAGFHAAGGLVHIDSGPVRHWS
jgi:uncharacterized protein YcbK (DUF882 family)